MGEEKMINVISHISYHTSRISYLHLVSRMKKGIVCDFRFGARCTVHGREDAIKLRIVTGNPRSEERCMCAVRVW